MHLYRVLLAAVILIPACIAQTPQLKEWNPGADLARRISEGSGKRLRVGFEFRSRPEARTGNAFGQERHLEYALVRTRFSAQLRATPWLRLSGMAQDARAPLYGVRVPPPNARDTLDLQEGYMELFPDAKTGFGAILGRQMITLGDGRLIGSPQWANTSRTFDTARFYYRLPGVRIEFLMVSSVKIRPDAFNQPVLNDRAWGMYHTLPGISGDGSTQVYVLRHDQNRPGGFAGVGRLGINIFGARFAGPLPGAFRYVIEPVGQTGHVGPLPHRALGFVSTLTRTFDLGLPLDVSAEYKYASGSDDPARSGSFDQLYPASHDKFGHADLFGWRNLHNVRGQLTLRPNRTLALNLMYNNNWLASATDALYNTQQRAIARSAAGAAGTHVGQELDVFATQRWGAFTFGAGFGQLFTGEFLRNTTPGVNSRYLYLSQTYGF
jgi:Alginate export